MAAAQAEIFLYLFVRAKAKKRTNERKKWVRSIYVCIVLYSVRKQMTNNLMDISFKKVKQRERGREAESEECIRSY